MADDVREMLRQVDTDPQPVGPDRFDALWKRGRRQRRTLQITAATASTGVAVVALAVLSGLVESPAGLEVADQPGPTCVADVTTETPMLGPEASARSDDGIEVWALFFLKEPLPAGEPIRLPANQEIKIAWRATGDGPMAIDAVGPDGQVVEPVWGPQGHAGSNWGRPGQEWSTGWVFPADGCWTFQVHRGDAEAQLQFDVDR